MERVIYNIGYNGIGSGILTWYPESMECSFPEFVKIVRNQESIKHLFEFAEMSFVPPSSLVLMLRIENEVEYWEHTIKLINVREYRKYWELKYNKTWKEN